MYFSGCIINTKYSKVARLYFQNKLHDHSHRKLHAYSKVFVLFEQQKFMECNVREYSNTKSIEVFKIGIQIFPAPCVVK